MTAIRVSATSIDGRIVDARMQRLVSVDIETGAQTWEDDLNSKWKFHHDGTGYWMEYTAKRSQAHLMRKRSFKRARIAQKKAGLLCSTDLH